MKNYILGFITAVSLTVGLAGAYVPYSQLTSNGFTTHDLEEVIFEAVNRALKNNRR